MAVDWEDSFAGFCNFFHEAMRESDAGQKRFRYGALNAALGHGLKDDVQSSQHGGSIEKRRQCDRFTLV